MNVLMLDEKRVVVEANEVPIQKMFESLGKCVAVIVVAVSFTLSSNTTATKETFIVLKIFILHNFALFHLTVHKLRFFYAKFQSTGSSGLVSTRFTNLTRFSL